MEQFRVEFGFGFGSICLRVNWSKKFALSFLRSNHKGFFGRLWSRRWTNKVPLFAHARRRERRTRGELPLSLAPSLFSSNHMIHCQLFDTNNWSTLQFRFPISLSRTKTTTDEDPAVKRVFLWLPLSFIRPFACYSDDLNLLPTRKVHGRASSCCLRKK